MSTITPQRNIIQNEEVNFRAPAANGTWNRIGASVNELLAGFKKTEFTTPGSHSFLVPNGVTLLFYEAVGGGGAGGQRSGYGGPDPANYSPGGGAGCKAIFGFLTVTPNTSYNITVGAGGAGNGLVGGDTIFDSVVLCKGAGGGAIVSGSSGAIRPGAPGSSSYNAGGAGGSNVGPVNSGNGEPSEKFSGGAGGLGANVVGGGGGASSYGAGGNGATGTGGNGGGYGAGGGGGNFGGAGGDGYLAIYYI